MAGYDDETDYYGSEAYKDWLQMGEASDLAVKDENRSGTGSVYRTPAPMPGELMDYGGQESEGEMKFGMSPNDLQDIRKEARGPGSVRAGLEARSFQLPDWGIDVSQAGMAQNARARKAIQEEYETGLGEIEKGAQTRRRIEMGPAYAEAQMREQAGKARSAQLGAMKTQHEFETEVKATQEKRDAWDEYAAKVAKFDQALSAYKRSGGQTPGGKSIGMDERGYDRAKQQAWRELLAKLQTITGKPYGGLAAQPRTGEMEQWQYADPNAQYGPPAPDTATFGGERTPERPPEA
jgi:hypothetical protein